MKRLNNSGFYENLSRLRWAFFYFTGSGCLILFLIGLSPAQSYLIAGLPVFVAQRAALNIAFSANILSRYEIFFKILFSSIAKIMIFISIFIFLTKYSFLDDFFVLLGLIASTMISRWT